MGSVRSSRKFGFYCSLWWRFFLSACCNEGFAPFSRAELVTRLQRVCAVLSGLVMSLSVSAQEYRFHDDSAVDGSMEEGAFSFPPSGYSPYKQRKEPVKPRANAESLPAKSWDVYPQSPYGLVPQVPKSGGYGYGYFPGGLGGMSNQSGSLPFGFFPGSGLPFPW